MFAFFSIILAKYFITVVIKFELSVEGASANIILFIANTVLDKTKLVFYRKYSAPYYLKDQCFVPIFMHFRWFYFAESVLE